jgi:hypothetical protein
VIVDPSAGSYQVQGSATGPLALDTSFALAAWVYPTSFISDDQTYELPSILSRYLNNSDNSCDFRANVSTLEVAAVTAVDGGTLTLNTWQYVALAVNSSGVATLSIDGVVTGSGSPGAAVGPDGWVIGNSYMSERPWPGYLNDLSIWGGNSLAAANPATFFATAYEQTLRGNPETLNWY